MEHAFILWVLFESSPQDMVPFLYIMEMVKLFGGLMLVDPSLDEMTASFNSGSSMEKCQLQIKSDEAAYLLNKP